MKTHKARMTMTNLKEALKEPFEAANIYLNSGVLKNQVIEVLEKYNNIVKEATDRNAFLINKETEPSVLQLDYKTEHDIIVVRLDISHQGARITDACRADEGAGAISSCNGAIAIAAQDAKDQGDTHTGLENIVGLLTTKIHFENLEAEDKIKVANALVAQEKALETLPHPQ